MKVNTRKIWQEATFEVGSLDCVLAMCDHVQAMHGVDPAADWRGSYSTPDEADAICAPYGGLFGFCGYMLERAGLVPCAPADGLPIVCELNGVQFAGLMFGDRCGFLLDRGLLEMRASLVNILGAWRYET